MQTDLHDEIIPISCSRTKRMKIAFIKFGILSLFLIFSIFIYFIFYQNNLIGLIINWNIILLLIIIIFINIVGEELIIYIKMPYRLYNLYACKDHLYINNTQFSINNIDSIRLILWHRKYLFFRNTRKPIIPIFNLKPLPILELQLIPEIKIQNESYSKVYIIEHNKDFFNKSKLCKDYLLDMGFTKERIKRTVDE